LADQAGAPSRSPRFRRSVLDVRGAFRDWFSALVVDGRIADKEKLEQDKLKITARLINLVVAGGMLLFREDKGEEGGDVSAGPDILDEATFFRMLRRTIVTMLGELNAPDVNILKVSLSERFLERLQDVFTGARGRDGRFPVKIVQDVHPGYGIYVGINLRDTRSPGEDISRIERDPELRAEIVSRSRPFRRTDRDLQRLFEVTEKR
jgi:hypothetical protein